MGGAPPKPTLKVTARLGMNDKLYGSPSGEGDWPQWGQPQVMS